MTDKAIKATAQRIKQAIHRHGTITLIRDDEGKFHPLPGFDVRIIGVYSDGIAQKDIESDLQFDNEANHD